MDVSLFSVTKLFAIELGGDALDHQELVILTRMIIAILVGALLGYERRRRGRAAGPRTHMLVALGASLFTMVVMLLPGSTPNDLSQVVKGVTAGVGFLGAGAILKAGKSGEIQGLTTAASIWFTAAAGLAVGAGWIWAGVFGALLAWILLASGRWTESHDEKSNGH